MYYPTAFLTTFNVLSLSLKAVLYKIKLTKATSKGISIMMAVRLKFYPKRENKKIPLGWVGVNESSRCFLFSEL